MVDLIIQDLTFHFKGIPPLPFAAPALPGFARPHYSTAPDAGKCDETEGIPAGSGYHDR